jgi:hypothetical protein
MSVEFKTNWFAKAESAYAPAQVFAGDYGQPVADVFGNTRAEREAHARLIAAAPKMLKQLKRIAGVLGHLNHEECPGSEKNCRACLIEKLVAEVEGA